MPELPEVEVVRAGLEPAVTGALITGVEVFDQRSLRRHDASAGLFATLLENRRVLSVVRRGKFLWLPLAAAIAPAPALPERALVAHLGMSGQLRLATPGVPPARLVRVRLSLHHPDRGEGAVDFVDQRIFGSMAVDRLVPTGDGRHGGRGSALPLIPSRVSHIARDPLDPAFSDAGFFAALGRRNSGIKRVLLDQNVVSGIGNIYADEALWAARVHYDQAAATLSRRKAVTLLAELRAVLHRALAEGGTSFDTQYVNVNGASGYFSHSLNAYGRHGQPCPRCGRPLVRAPFMNRSSHFCPHCQRLPRTP